MAQLDLEIEADEPCTGKERAPTAVPADEEFNFENANDLDELKLD